MSVYSQPTRNAQLECARWLAYCLRIGWNRVLLDKLEDLWWQHHDFHGRLRASSASESPGDRL